MRNLGVRFALVATLVLVWLAQPLALGKKDLFDGDQLHDIWLRINSRDWQQLRDTYKENTYYPVDVEWNGVVVANAGIRSRGRQSRNPQKPGLRVDFNRYVAGQQFLGLKSLDLDNLTQDPSMIHERLAMLLFARMGLPAPRESHARLFVGGDREFAGVYGVVEPIDKDFVKNHFENNDGFLYNYQWQDPYFFEDHDNLDWYLPRFEPKTHETGSMYDLFAPIRRLVRAVNDAGTSTLESDLGQYFDVRTFITHIAIENFLSEPDGLLGGLGMSNFYLYRPEGSDVSHLIPWDKDLSFEQVDAPLPDHNIDQNILSRKIWEVPELRLTYLQTLLAVGASTDGWLDAEISHEYEQIRDVALSDSHTPYTPDQFEQSIASLRDFAARRSTIVRQYVEQMAPELTGASRLRR